MEAPSSAPSSATAPSPSQESSRFLEAAHIRPVEDGGIRRVDNGMLLRSDVRAVRR
ncbi:HNH endonuclease [Nocardioides alpinus]|uniref:HNH endonuclease n=1 Tax=Nocardioides alpinus TaxID=748909 RepID=UPI003558DC9C